MHTSSFEQLIIREDQASVSDGYSGLQTKQNKNEPSEHIWSETQAHPGEMTIQDECRQYPEENIINQNTTFKLSRLSQANS